MPQSYHASAAAVAVPLEALAPAEPGPPSAGSRILFTIAALLVYRLGTYIPIPGIHVVSPGIILEFPTSRVPGLYDVFAGGAAGRAAIFALSLLPYISTLIIMQFVTSLVPGLAAPRNEGERGRRLLNQYVRYLTVALAAVQAYAVACLLESGGWFRVVVIEPGALFRLSAAATMTGGAVFLMWLAEQITARGVGNGAALIITSGIVAGLPGSLADMLVLSRTGAISWPLLIAMAGLLLSVVAGIVFIEGARRRLPVQYPRRPAQHLPLRFNGGGVIAPVCASSLLIILITIAEATAGVGDCRPEWLCIIALLLSPGWPLYFLLDIVLIVFFAILCAPAVFNPQQTADDLRRRGGFVPGIRPGARTVEYIGYVQSRITVIGAMYLAAACVLPELVNRHAMQVDFSGNALVIVVVSTLELLVGANTLFRPPPST